MSTVPNPSPAPGPAQECIAFPTFDRREDQLRAKIQSKMTVATFLAGFAFAALLELIRDDRMALSLEELTAFLVLLTGGATSQALQPGDLFTLFAAMSLAIAMILFVGTVYSYDMLIMPLSAEPRDKDRCGRTKRVYRGGGKSRGCRARSIGQRTLALLVQLDDTHLGPRLQLGGKVRRAGPALYAVGHGSLRGAGHLCDDRVAWLAMGPISGAPAGRYARLNRWSGRFETGFEEG